MLEVVVELTPSKSVFRYMSICVYGVFVEVLCVECEKF